MIKNIFGLYKYIGKFLWSKLHKHKHCIKNPEDIPDFLMKLLVILTILDEITQNYLDEEPALNGVEIVIFLPQQQRNKKIL